MTLTHRRWESFSEDERLLLQERAKALAQKQEGEAQGEGVEVLELYSRGQRFALPLSSIASITELSTIAPLPRVPSAIRGLVSIRGELYIGIELALLVGNGSGGIADLRRVIVITDGQQSVAVLAEQIVGVKAVHTPQFQSDANSGYPFIVGTDESFLSLLNPSALMSFVFRLAGGAS